MPPLVTLTPTPLPITITPETQKSFWDFAFQIVQWAFDDTKVGLLILAVIVTAIIAIAIPKRKR